MSSPQTFSGFSKDEFHSKTAAKFDEYLTSIEFVAKAAALLFPDADTAKQRLTRMKSEVDMFHLVFDFIGLAGGAATAGRSVLKALFKELASTLAQKFAMDLAYELSRPEFTGTSGPDDKIAMSRTAEAVNYYRAASQLLVNPDNSRALGNAYRSGPVTNGAIDRFMQAHHGKLEDFARTVAGKIWDQVFHGSNFIVPKAGIEFETLWRYCYSVVRFSVLLDALDSNLTSFKPMVTALKTAQYRDGAKMVSSFASFSALQKPELNEAWLDQRIATWIATVASAQEIDWFTPLFKK